MLTATLVSLIVNAAVRFGGNAIEIALSRAEEMTLEVILPVLILAGYELYYATLRKEAPAYHRLFGSPPETTPTPSSLSADADNRRGVRVIATGVLAVGGLIVILGLLADFAQGLIGGTGIGRR